MIVGTWPRFDHADEMAAALAALAGGAGVIAGLLALPTNAAGIAARERTLTPIAFEESAHYPFVEEPAAFQHTVRGWLARPRDSAGGIQATWHSR